jgi:hypothetical protein
MNALMWARKLVRGLRQGLSENERYLIANDVVLLRGARGFVGDAPLLVGDATVGCAQDIWKC